MWTIRQEQVEEFRRSEIQKFEDRMIKHIGKFFPKQCGELGETKTREAIRHGMKRAASYGIVAERDVCKYISLMLVLGRDFDRDPRLPWARQALDAPLAISPSRKLVQLQKKAQEKLAEGR